MRTRRTLIALPLLVASSIVVPASAEEMAPSHPVIPVGAAPAPPMGEVGYRSLPHLPTGSEDSGAAGVERSAIELAAALHAVPMAKGSAEACPDDRLTVGWADPGPTYGHGAYVKPLGPAPTAGTTAVNGVVTCAGAPWAFMGFEARYVDGRWDVMAVPFVDEEVGVDHDHEHEHPPEEADHGHPVAPAPVPTPAAAAAAATPTGTPIDDYARYEPQRTCSPNPKPGTSALQRTLLEGAPGSRSLGIARACHIGGTSEHKEGRAFDWGVLVHRPAEKAAADAFLAQLLATDEAGNRHALARRMGVMYVIWDHQVWSAYRPEAGWRPYSGRSPHTDHVHISLSWAGAMGRTSYWSGQAVQALGPLAPAAPAPASAPVATPTSAPTAEHHGHDHDDDHDDAAKAAAEEAERQREAAEDARREQEKAAEDARRRQERAAEDARRQQEKAAEDARRRQEKAAEEARRQEERATREAEKAAAAAERQKERGAADAGGPPPGRGGGKGKGRGRGGG